MVSLIFAVYASRDHRTPYNTFHTSRELSYTQYNPIKHVIIYLYSFFIMFFIYF